MRLEHHLCRAWRVDAFNGEFPHCERLLQIWKRLLQEGHQARLRGKTLVLWTRASITGHLFQIMILSTWGDELSSFCNLVVKSSGSTRPSIRPFTERSIRTSFKQIAISPHLYQPSHIPGDTFRLITGESQQRCQEVLALDLDGKRL